VPFQIAPPDGESQGPVRVRLECSPEGIRPLRNEKGSTIGAFGVVKELFPQILGPPGRMVVPRTFNWFLFHDLLGRGELFLQVPPIAFPTERPTTPGRTIADEELDSIAIPPSIGILS